MTWFLVAAIAPVLYAVSNYIDKILLSKYIDTHSIPALIIVSAFVGLLFFPILFLFEISIFSLGIFDILIMLLVGALGIIALFPYFYAHDSDETSLVVPIFQSIPVFSYFLGVVFLGEQLTTKELVGASLIVLGSIAISIDLNVSKFKVKFKMLALMLLSSFIFALSAILFKFVVVDASFTAVIFWEYLGALLVGAVLLFKKSYREEALLVVKNKATLVVGLNVVNEFVCLIANVCLRFAQTLVPVALAISVNGFQPIFVFLFGILLTLYFPRVLQEDLSRKLMIQKISCIVVIVAGAFLIV